MSNSRQNNGLAVVIVGASGAGKDTIINKFAELQPDFCVARRYITRNTLDSNEAFISVPSGEFKTLAQEDVFCLTWSAHDCQYGISKDIYKSYLKGERVVLSISRSVLNDAIALFPSHKIINITANQDILRSRLLARGRENSEQIDARIARSTHKIPQNIQYSTLHNNGSVDEAVSTLMTLIEGQEEMSL